MLPPAGWRGSTGTHDDPGFGQAALPVSLCEGRCHVRAADIRRWTPFPLTSSIPSLRNTRAHPCPAYALSRGFFARRRLSQARHSSSSRQAGEHQTYCFFITIISHQPLSVLPHCQSASGRLPALVSSCAPVSRQHPVRRTTAYDVCRRGARAASWCCRRTCADREIL